MLLAVTTNPTIDRTLQMPEMTLGAVHRTTQVHLAAGGEGINVCRAALRLGCEVLTTGSLAGRAGQIVDDLATNENLPADWYWLSSGETRTCILIDHEHQNTTVINEAGPQVSAEDWAGFVLHVERLAENAGAVAFSGRPMVGIEPDALGKLARSLAKPDRAVYIDTDEDALSAVLARPRDLCIKVNRSDLAVSLGLQLENTPPMRALIEAGQMLLERGAALVVVTLGQDGALAIAPTRMWQASPPSIKVLSTVGCGEAFLAGLAAARLEEQSLEAAVAFAVACGTANAMTALPVRFERAEVEKLLKQISIQPL
jgi:1-phosphofructokinase family hexose kinase